MPRRKTLKICPRCGLEFSYYETHRIGDKEYLYAVHYEGYSKDSSGKIRKKVRKCYLGPVSAYEYVTKMHFREGLVLRGLIDPDRAISYINALINYIRRSKLDPGEALKLADKFQELAKALREIAEREGGK